VKKRSCVFLFKACAAMLVAFVILNFICMFYYNLAIHSHSDTGATDYVWEANKFYSRGTEGFAWGKTDANGFNNLKTLEAGQIDVLVMGSSHMEAFNVAQDKNTVAVLNNMFHDSGMDMNAYNIGISGHTLARCLNNAVEAVKEFAPQKYLIVETSKDPDFEDMKAAVEGKLEPIESNSGGIVGTLQKLPFLRRVYAQWKSSDEAEEKAKDGDVYQLFDILLKRVVEQCDETGIKVIIVYHNRLEYDGEGKIVSPESMETKECLKNVCEENNVVFVDMHEAFKANYEETFQLPHGFSNSRAGAGHLNEVGHRVIAEEVFNTICRLEGKVD